jgi:hypothetical protein
MSKAKSFRAKMCRGQTVGDSHVKPLPVLGNVEAPFEFKVLLLVIIDEGGDCVVVATSQHARRRIFFLDCRNCQYRDPNRFNAELRFQARLE